MTGLLGEIEVGGFRLLPWAVALHAVALPAAVGVAVARFRATVPPPVRWVTVAAGLGGATTLLTAAAVRWASPRAASTLVATFGPALGLVVTLLGAALVVSLVHRQWATGLSAALLGLALLLAAAPLSFLTTPGRWPESRALADALLNPTLLPLLVGRAGAVVALCGACLLVCANRGGDAQLRRAVTAGAVLAVGGVALAALGAWLWLRAVGPQPLALLAGEARLATGASRVLIVAAPAFTAVAILFAIASALRVRAGRRGAVALLLLLAAAAFGGAEVARVTLSGPWAVGAPGGGWLLANGLTATEADGARRAGLASVLPAVGPAGERPSPERGGRLFDATCRGCHAARAVAARVDGWSHAAIAAAVLRLDRLSAASPAFPGTADDAKDLAAHLAGLGDGARGPPPPPDRQRIAAGRKAFEQACAHCHREIRLDRRVAGWNEPLALRILARLPRVNPAMQDVTPAQEDRAALAAWLVALGGGRGK